MPRSGDGFMSTELPHYYGAWPVDKQASWKNQVSGNLSNGYFLRPLPRLAYNASISSTL